MLRCRLWMSNKMASCAAYGRARAAYRHRKGAAMTVLVEPFASVYDDRSRLGIILARGRAASRLMPPTIIAWDSFQARARPLPRLPRRARGSLEQPPKTSPNGANNDCPRLRCRRQPSDQPQDRQGAQPRSAFELARPRRRDDRVNDASS